MENQYSVTMPRLGYGGIFKRIAAYAIDSFIIGWPSYAIAYAMMRGDEDAAAFIFPVAVVISSVLGIIYYAVMESSSWRATLGKVAMGLITTDKEGNKLSFGKALIRGLVKSFISIGAIAALFTSQKQALHDLAAGSLVFKD